MFLLACTLSAQPLSDGERERAARELEASRQELLDSIAGLTAAQWTWRPAPGRWSVAECAEHIVAAEAGYMAIVEKMLARPATPERRKEVAGKDDHVLREMQNRESKRETGEALTPTGRFATEEETRAQFNRGRDKLIEYVRTTRAALRDHHQAHRAVGLIDAYQWILLASGHSRRHTAQIEEVKASPGFPGR